MSMSDSSSDSSSGMLSSTASLPASRPFSVPFFPSLPEDLRRTVRGRVRSRGRPTLLDEGLSPEEQNQRKRLDYAKRVRAEATSEARRAASTKRWRKKYVADAVVETEPATVVDSEVQEEMEFNELVQESQDLEMQDPEPQEQEVQEQEPLEQQPSKGGSANGKVRAKKVLQSYLDGRSSFEQLDIVRDICLALKKSGVVVIGLEIEKRKDQLISHLSKHHIQRVKRNLLQQSKTMSSLQFWLPTLLIERIKLLEQELGG